MYHRAFGLRIKSNLPIPGLLPAPASATIDIEVLFGIAPRGRQDGDAANEVWVHTSSEHSDSGLPLYRLEKLPDGEYFRLSYSDGSDFVFERAAAKLWVNWREPLTLDDAATYLLGPVFGLLLRLRGATCLHASAVVVDGHAIAFVGHAGAGKSTTAAGFASMGFAVLCDDVLALAERRAGFFVEPGYPRLRLWPDAVTMLCGAPDALPPLTPNWEKRFLDLSKHPYRYQAHALPLAAVYLFDDRADCASAPRIEGLRARDGLMRLIANSYANLFLDGAMRACELEALGRLVDSVPVRALCPHADSNNLANLCQTILDDVDQLTCTEDSVRAPSELGHV